MRFTVAIFYRIWIAGLEVIGGLSLALALIAACILTRMAGIEIEVGWSVGVLDR